ncbi:DUF1883 domain-containing protein [Streptomyces microflavus]|uniref:DUF1883 domain-containing protein n=1 Tax=Streptomyces microflavus TaxID=1919 RepID=UPI0038645282
MDYFYKDLGNLKRGSTVIVTLRNQANVQVMTRSEYSKYKSGKRYRYCSCGPFRLHEPPPYDHERSAKRAQTSRIPASHMCRDRGGSRRSGTRATASATGWRQTARPSSLARSRGQIMTAGMERRNGRSGQSSGET